MTTTQIAAVVVDVPQQVAAAVVTAPQPITAVVVQEGPRGLQGPGAGSGWTKQLITNAGTTVLTAGSPNFSECDPTAGDQNIELPDALTMLESEIIIERISGGAHLVKLLSQDSQEIYGLGFSGTEVDLYDQGEFLGLVAQEASGVGYWRQSR